MTVNSNGPLRDDDMETVGTAGQATGAQLIGRVPGGQFFKPIGGAWTKK